jgi:hypothetical protein
MIVNNLEVKTLHPNNKIAVLYRSTQHLTNKTNIVLERYKRVTKAEEERNKIKHKRLSLQF